MYNIEESALIKLPMEDLVELYQDTLQKLIELQMKPYTMEDKEKLKAELKATIKQLYANIGVDFEKEVQKITKQ